jgi:glycolate oxidase FAD binding subunit
LDTLAFDEVSMPIRTPASPAEIGDLVREASASSQGVYPAGGRTMLDLGLPPLKPGFAVDLRGLNRVVDYPARDMTITVQAGITLAELAKTLDAEHQCLPIDVPQPEQATLGGAIATNTSGPRRYGYGTLRDYVIGISFIADDGGEVKAGGRVVKNVAGYDLMKLQVGALGTLGVVTQVTLKVRPKPEATEHLHFTCDRDSLPAALDRLHATKSRPVIADIAAESNAGWCVHLDFEEKRETVDWQAAALRKEIAADSILRPSTGQQPNSSPPDAAWFIWKANIRASQTANFCNEAVKLRPTIAVHAHALNGIVYGHVADEMSEADAARMVKNLASLAADAGGNLTIRRCPPAWKKTLPVWGRASGDRELMRRIKMTLDPKNVFNPGRLFGDL